MLAKPAQHGTAQRVAANRRELCLHTLHAHNSLLLTLENVTECSVGGIPEVGVLTLMLQATPLPGHVHHHEAIAVCSGRVDLLYCTSVCTYERE